VVHCLAYSFLDCRDEVLWNRSTNDLILESESLSTIHRREFNPAVTELSFAACLSFVATLCFCSLPHGFLVGDARILDLNAKVNALIDAEVGADDGSMYPGPPASYRLGNGAAWKPRLVTSNESH